MEKARYRVSSANLVDSVTRDTSLLRGSAKIPQSASRRVTSLVTPTKFSEKIAFVSSSQTYMKIAFVFVLYKTSTTEIERLKKEVKQIGFSDYKVYFINNTKNNRGYAGGVNEGIKKAFIDNCQLLIVANPDISLKHLRGVDWLEAGRYFDVFGLAMRQDNKIYYGGEIDKWAGSGGLIEKKPEKRFVERDFVSGSLMVIKKKVVDKIGFFDESYFMYYEDVDYCWRAKQAGFKVGVDSQLIYDHYEVSKNNPKKESYLAAGRVRFLSKHGSIRQRLSDRFFVNFFSLNLSSFLNKLLHFILFLFLVRYLSPAQYGIYVFVWAHIGLLLPLLDFGTTSYGLVYLPLASQKNIFSLFSLRLFLSFIVFALTIVFAILLKYNSQLILFIILTSFVILANTFSGSFLILTSIKEKIYLSSLASLFFNFFLVIGLVLTLLLFKNLFFIFFTNFVAYNLYSTVNLFLISKELGRFKFLIDFARWQSILKKSTIFLLISLFANLYFKLDVFLLNFLKGSAAVGLYSSGYKFLEASLIIASSYNVSSLPILSRLQKESQLAFKNKIRKDLLFVVPIGLFIALLFSFAGPLFLPLFLPGTYWQSIKVLQIVIVALPFILATSVFLNSLYAMGKAHLAVFIFIFQSLFNFSLNLLFIPRYSYFASAYITLLGEILNTAITFIFMRRLLGGKHENQR